MSRVNEIIERSLTDTFTRDLSYTAPILFTRVRTLELPDSGNPPSKGLVCKINCEYASWEVIARKFDIISWVERIRCDKDLALKTSAYECFYDGQFTLSTR